MPGVPDPGPGRAPRRAEEAVIALHPQAQAFLEAFIEFDSAFPPLSERSAAAWRDGIAQLQAEGAAAGIGPPLQSEQDRTIPGPAGAVPIRILTPGTSGPYPLLVWFHGGGWVTGGLDGGLDTLRLLANVASCVIVSVDYRLAPEHPYPAGLDDCYAALEWAAANAAELEGDAARIAVGGDSAGGNLAAVVAQKARDEGGPAIGFQLLVCPVTDSDFETQSYRERGIDEYLLSREMMEWFWAHYLGPDGDARDPRMAPLRAESLEGLPTAHIVVAGYDPLLDEGVAYAERARASRRRGLAGASRRPAARLLGGAGHDRRGRTRGRRGGAADDERVHAGGGRVGLTLRPVPPRKPLALSELSCGPPCGASGLPYTLRRSRGLGGSR